LKQIRRFVLVRFLTNEGNQVLRLNKGSHKIIFGFSDIFFWVILEQIYIRFSDHEIRETNVSHNLEEIGLDALEGSF
jgi:Zn/Cd-binding protein ZinT